MSRIPVPQHRYLLFNVLTAALLLMISVPNLYSDTRLIVAKFFRGGKEMTANPNQVIANWSLTIDKVTTERSIVFVGRSGDNMIDIESRETNHPVGGVTTRDLSVQKIPIYLECDGETIVKVEDFTFSMRMAGNTLYYTILSDWETTYINIKEATKTCANGHKWVNKDFHYCPTCGAFLK